MQVKIGKLTLAGKFSESVSDYRYTRSTDVQVGKVFRSTPKIFDRGNNISRMTFTVTRVFDHMTDAIAFMHDHPESLPTDGGILEVSLTYDHRSIRRFFSKAVVEVVEARFVGVTTIHTYSITGVGLSKTTANVTQPTVLQRGGASTGVSDSSLIIFPVDSIPTLALLKGLQSDPGRRVMHITDDTPDIPKSYKYKHGDTTAPDEPNIVAPTDNGGRWYAFNNI